MNACTYVSLHVIITQEFNKCMYTHLEVVVEVGLFLLVVFERSQYSTVFLKSEKLWLELLE